MEDLFWIGFVGAAIALLFAWLQRSRVMSFSEGNEKMRKIAASIREGANAYLKHQYTTVFKVFLVVFILLLIIAFGSGGKMLSQFTPFAFLTGGIWSMLAGFIGMKIATNSNARTAQAASESLNKGLRVAFSSGSVMGFTVVGLGMLDITIWFFLHKNFAKILCKLYIPALADGCPPCYTEFCNPQRERREQYDELELAGSRRCGRPDLYGRQLEAQRAVRTESDGEPRRRRGFFFFRPGA